MTNKTLPSFLRVSEGQALIDALDEWRDVLCTMLIRKGRFREAIELKSMSEDRWVR